MNRRRRALALAERRERLVLRSQSQREAIASLALDMARSLGWVDMALQALAWARRHPLHLAAPLLLLAAWRPARAVRLGGLALTLWRAIELVHRGAPPR